MPVLQYRVPLTTPLISFFALTTFPLKKIIPKLCKNFLCRGLLLAVDRLKTLPSIPFKADREWGYKLNNWKHWFFSFLQKKPKLLFFKFSPTFWGVFFGYKKPWNILGINDCTSNVFDIDLQDFFNLAAVFAFPFL